jgi:hypothetical protein
METVLRGCRLVGARWHEIERSGRARGGIAVETIAPPDAGAERADLPINEPVHGGYPTDRRLAAIARAQDHPRDLGVMTAVVTSMRAVVANPTTMAMWGLIVAGSLCIGSVPFFVGLAVVLPVLGHATWHLYRRVVEPAQR